MLYQPVQNGSTEVSVRCCLSPLKPVCGVRVMRFPSGLQPRLLRIYWALKRWIVPDVTGSQFIYRDALVSHLKNRPRWLDLGCGHQFLPDWVGNPDRELLFSLPRMVGVDGDLQSIKRHALLRDKGLADIGHLPFSADSFDLVSANMVMEHVQDPARILNEVRRVLAPGGLFLFHTPNSSSPALAMGFHVPERLKKRLIGFLEDRSEEDIYPTAYRINTRSQVIGFGSTTGFDIESCRLVTSDAFTARLGPLALFELLFIKLTQWTIFQSLRPDMIVVLRKKHTDIDPVGPAGIVTVCPLRLILWTMFQSLRPDMIVVLRKKHTDIVLSAPPVLSQSARLD